MLAQADSPWDPSMQRSTSTAEAADPPVMAAMSPFIGTAPNRQNESADSPTTTIWFAISAVTVLVAVATIWRSRRH
jgi:hypothetical protein